MNSERDLERAVRAWVAEGSEQLPDDYLDAALDEISMTPQGRARWRAPAFSQMNNIMRLSIASAAVVLVAISGILLSPSSGVRGPGIVPPTSPTPAATPIQLTAQDTSARLDAGTYAIGDPFPVRVAVTTPDAWTMWALTPDVTGVDKASRRTGFGLWIADNVFVDPCQPYLGELAPPVGPSVDDLAAALEDLSFYEVTQAIDVTFAGLPAKQLEITAPVDVAGCDGNTYAWSTPGGDRKFLTAGEHAVMTILEVDGTRLIVYAVDFPGASDADRAELEAVVQSISFDLP
jgi:hypothetical protein